MGSCISGGNFHTRLLVLGEGGGGGGEGDTKLFFFLLLTYLRPVLIFINPYSDSMSFSSIFSWKLRIIPY